MDLRFVKYWSVNHVVNLKTELSFYLIVCLEACFVDRHCRQNKYQKCELMVFFGLCTKTNNTKKWPVAVYQSHHFIFLKATKTDSFSWEIGTIYNSIIAEKNSIFQPNSDFFPNSNQVIFVCKQKVQPEQTYTRNIEKMLSLICGFAEKYLVNIYCGETGLRIVLRSP